MKNYESNNNNNHLDGICNLSNLSADGCTEIIVQENKVNLHIYSLCIRLKILASNKVKRRMRISEYEYYRYTHVYFNMRNF